MFQKINEKVRLSKRIKRYIKSLKPLSGGEWDSNDDINKQLKTYIRKQLEKYQNNKCAYCGLQLGETGKTEIEHIAPKGGSKQPKYPQYAYTTYNLVLSCNLCNSPSKKGKKDTISKLDKINYKNCEFNIIHPYFDDPNDHIDFVASGYKILVMYKTEKGKATIDMFKLDGEAHCSARAKQVRFEREKESANIEDLIREALIHKKRSGF